jgi:hypothetical protein
MATTASEARNLGQQILELLVIIDSGTAAQSLEPIKQATADCLDIYKTKYGERKVGKWYQEAQARLQHKATEAQIQKDLNEFSTVLENMSAMATALKGKDVGSIAAGLQTPSKRKRDICDDIGKKIEELETLRKKIKTAHPEETMQVSRVNMAVEEPSDPSSPETSRGQDLMSDTASSQTAVDSDATLGAETSDQLLASKATSVDQPTLTTKSASTPGLPFDGIQTDFRNPSKSPPTDQRRSLGNISYPNEPYECQLVHVTGSRFIYDRWQAVRMEYETTEAELRDHLHRECGFDKTGFYVNTKRIWLDSTIAPARERLRHEILCVCKAEDA